MYAVTTDRLNAIHFLSERPQGEGLKIQEGVGLDIPSNLELWPSGEPGPEQVLCVSLSDPKHYKLFKFSRDIDPTEFEPTGKSFGGVFSKTAWERFWRVLSTKESSDPNAEIDPPGPYEEAMRSLRGDR